MHLAAACVLAWRLTTHDKGRLAGSMGGIAFAVLLMLLQLGFRNALLDSSVQLLDRLNADAIVLSSSKSSYLERDTIPRERLQQALAVRGVATAFPVWVGLFLWKNLETGVLRPIRTLGFDPADPAWLLDELERGRERLAEPGTAFLDRRSRAYYGRIGAGPAEVSRRSIQVLGTFAVGTDFESDGNLIVGRETFFQLAAGSERTSRVELVLLRVEPGADPAEVVGRLRAVLPRDSAAYTRAELRARELEHWETGTPISIVFALGTGMGFIVGVVICYQILYTDVTDHLVEFATFKAIGYGNDFLVATVLAEALCLSLVAFVPSVALGAALYALLGSVTGLLLELTLARVGTVLALTLGMCVVAGLLALRRVLEADPAEVF